MASLCTDTTDIFNKKPEILQTWFFCNSFFGNYAKAFNYLLMLNWLKFWTFFYNNAFFRVLGKIANLSGDMIYLYSQKNSENCTRISTGLNIFVSCKRI